MILDKKYKEPPIGVIGAGAWGTAISKLLCKRSIYSKLKKNVSHALGCVIDLFQLILYIIRRPPSRIIIY